MTAPSFSHVQELLARGVAERVFPAAVIEVGSRHHCVWRDRVGHLTYDEDAPAVEVATIFDLASLTKVIATATLAMLRVSEGRLRLESRVADHLEGWRGPDREEVQVRDLLAHSSGLTAYLPFFRDCSGRPEFEAAIGQLPLEYEPRTRSVYSDLGFMLLGFILQDLVGEPLDVQFERLVRTHDLGVLLFNPPRRWRAQVAPTEQDAWRGRLLIGEVHDENAWALGGVAAHAGLFGTAAAVGAFARLLMATLSGSPALVEPAVARAFCRRSQVPGSSRALGWDTALPTSSCGTLMSPQAVGHTGFTGTSLWIDPELDLYVVLLTNRVHPTRSNDAILGLRPRIHDAVVRTMRGASS